MRLNGWWLAPVLVLGALGATIKYRTAVPDRSHWKAAVESIRVGLEEGDGVAWAPYWAGEGRLFLEGLPAFHLPNLETPDLSRYERVWLLGAFGRNADDLVPPHQLIERLAFGPLTLDLIQVGGQTVISDFYEDLSKVEVKRVQGARSQACDFWSGRGWYCLKGRSAESVRACLNETTAARLKRHRRRSNPSCGLDPLLNVSRDIRVIGAMPRRCVWVHPVAGKTVVVKWPGVSLGKELIIDHGFTDKVTTDNYLKETRAHPISVRMLKNGELLGEHVIAPESGWRRWTVPTQAGQGDIQFEFTTQAHLDAHLCIDVTSRGARP